MVKSNSRSSPLTIPINPIQAHQDDVINTLMAQVTSLAKIVQSLQAPLSNPIHSKELPTVMDSQDRTEIEKLKQVVKSLNKPKNLFAKDPFDDLLRISLPPNCPLDLENTMEPQTLFIISKLLKWKQGHTLKIDKF